MSSTVRRFRWIDGEVREVTERDASPTIDRGPMVGSAYNQANPGKSIAMSVHPDDCSRMNEEIRKRGIPGVRYDPTKRHNCVIESRRGRRELMKAFGELVGMQNVHDADGGYGDG